MRRAHPLRALATVLTTAAASLGLVLSAGGAAPAAPTTATTTATAAATPAAAQQALGTPMPARVFAPYFEAWTGESPATLSAQSGAKYLTMAFIQTPSRGSCTPYWNGDTGMPISQSTFGADIATIRAAGGDVIPSFGGYTAGNTGTEISDSCTNVNSIASAIQNVISTYDLTRICLDVEDNSLTNTAGIDRRNKALKQVQAWAASTGRPLQIQYTLPTTTQGLAPSGLAVLQNAVTNGTKVDVVNIMTFDYYDNQPHQMAEDAKTAATGLKNQLAQLYPTKTQAELWAMVGVTVMPGVDDFGPAETFTTADAVTVYNWARTQGISTLSMWALQRDNGNCPGGGAADNCSGIPQELWQFTRTFAPFTSGGPVTNDFSLGVSPGAGSVAKGASTSATINTAVTAGSAQNVALTVTGAPTGVTATITPTSVTAGGSATVNIAASASATPGTYPLTINGVGPSATHSATYQLTVTSGPTTDDFSILVAPASGTVAQGGTGTATINTTVTAGSAQNVALTVTGAPIGVTATVDPTSVNAGSSATLSIAVSTSAQTGTFPLTVTGVGPSATHSATYLLTVTAISGGGLLNADLESGTLSPWTCQPGGAVVTTVAHGGTHAIEAAAGPAQTGECRQTLQLAPNSTHTLTGWVRGNYAYLGVSGGASGSTWASPGATWTKLTVPFTVGASGSVTVYLHGWYAQGSVYGDDFAIS
ncbi:glycosyl hydrolase family 18 protein [Embleya sp. NPDC050154]|uniref:glycosyl hydrolase family 18 protein n=1 Tax=Embleya sp. NPDC050154 TaxID=3363988 RepID=UPI003796DC13